VTPSDDPGREDDVADAGAAPLEEFAAAWRALEPPAVDDLEATPDPATRASIEWLRAAWQAAAPPAPRELPWSLRMRRTLRRAAPWSALVATAAAIVLLLSPVRHRSPADSPALPPTVPVEQVAIGPRTPERTPPATEIHADRMEMRSGNVRLILFTSSPPPRAPDAIPETRR
jgi:hypothetical protein